MLKTIALNLRPMMLCPLIAAVLGGNAAGAESPPSQAWALLIGCERYEKAPPLQYVINDVEGLTDTLVKRADYSPNKVTRLHEGLAGGRLDRATIEKVVEEFLAEPAANDRVIVYFSGHGFLDDRGRLYLAPTNCDPADPSATGVPVQWIREKVAACRARTKIMLLDTCHAGSERVKGMRKSIDAAAIAEEFRGLDRVVTIASSSASQPSRLDDDHQLSLFTYWLIEGIKGAADTSRDGNLEIDEVFGYVERAVRDRSKGLQTPVRIIRPGVEGVPILARLVPQRLDTVLDDIATRLADRIAATKTDRVGVLEFVDATAAGELLGVEYGVLGKYCAEALQRRLVDIAGDRFRVTDSRRLRQALRDKQFAPSSLDDARQMQALSAAAGGMPAVVVGSLRGDVMLDGRNAGEAIVQIEARLTTTERSDDLGRAAGLAVLSDSEWAMRGRSVVADDKDRPIPSDAFAASHPVALGLIEWTVAPTEALAAKARRSRHPLTDPGFGFPVKIMVQQGARLVERPGRMEGADWVVTLARGEQYVVRVGNRTGKPVFMRLLVDGLNTRLEHEPVKGKGVSTLVAGMRVNLDRARPWLLDPTTPDVFRENSVPTWDLKGFEKTEGAGGGTEFGRFTVVDAASSLAERRGFADQIGTITAAFYQELGSLVTSSRERVGTDAGETYREPVNRDARGTAVGRMLAAVTIRYVASDR